jgi:hypothetical protein
LKNTIWKLRKCQSKRRERRKLVGTAIAIVGIILAAFVQHQGITNAVVAVVQSNFKQRVYIVKEV